MAERLAGGAGRWRLRRGAIVAAGIGVIFATQAGASVLCQKRKSGQLVVRAASCGRGELAFDLTAFVPAVSAAPGGGLTAAGGSFSIAAGGVSKSALAADARAAAGSVVLAGSTNATTATTLDSFTVDVPAAGTLFVTVSGMLMIDADATTASSITVAARIGLCDTPSSETQCGGTYNQVWYQDPDDADVQNNNATPAFTLVRTVPIASAGQRVFYLNGEKPPDVTANGLSLWQDNIVGTGPVATAMFFPAPLTVTSP